MSALAAYAASFDEAVAAVLPAAGRTVPALVERLAAAGVDPSKLTTAAALGRVPVMTKDDLLARQQAAPPFGGALAPGARVRRVFQSPGPLYEPEPDGADPWRWAPALAAAGVGTEDVVLNAFGYHLSPAGAMFEEAARALDATVVPAGVGNLELQATACADLGVTVLIGVPSYLKALLERAETAGHDVGAWPLRVAFVSAEPLPPSLRAWLAQRVGVVRQGYGTAETGNLGYECAREEGLHVPADALVEVCDLSTGAPRDDGEGQVVVTVLSPDCPVVRFGTGDLSAWMDEPCPCNLPTPRLRGWLGRVGDAVKVRGMFLHPRQVDALMAGVAEVDAWRFVITRADHRDQLRCEVVGATGADPSTLGDRVRTGVRSGLRFDVEVVTVDAIDSGASVVDERAWD